MRLPLLGKHNVMNAVTAATASLAAGTSLGDISKGLEKLTAIAGRLEIKTGINGARVLDDTYNANPDSVGAGLEVLREAEGEKVLVLGDMAELGDASEEIHRRVGELARRVGVNRLIAVGPLSRNAATAFGKSAFVANSIRTFSGNSRSDPDGLTLCSSMTRKSVACTCGGRWATSSRKSVPPSACRNKPSVRC